MFSASYFREYRNKIGFSNQNDLKAFLSAKDVKSEIDFFYIEKLNFRLCEIVRTLNSIVHNDIKISSIEQFCNENITSVYQKLKKNGILPKLNNQGRRPEQVYFSWMRGAIISQFFIKALASIFDVAENEIEVIGDDKIDDIENFKRQPTADLQIKLDSKIFQIEMQSGYQGINDIKEHKVRQARRQFLEKNIRSLIVHVDLFNGQVAFVDVSDIKDNDINWITRQQMEGQTVFNISQNYFIWRLIEMPPKLKYITEFII